MEAILELFVRLVVGIIRVVSGGIADWWEKRRLKRQLREGLGREVDSLELTSLKTWMEMPSRKLPRK
jgi:hypothetical protein